MSENKSGAIGRYHLEGVDVVRSLLDQDEIDILIKEADRLWDENKHFSALNIRVGLRSSLDGKDLLERLDPVADISPLFRALNEDQRIVQLAVGALGEPAIPMKEKLIYKWPGTSGYGAHRDQHYFASSGATGQEMVSIAIALDKADANNGAIKVYPQLRLVELAPPPGEPRDIDAHLLESEPFFMPHLKPGDVLMFDGITPHRSEVNTSNICRRTYTMTFVPARLVDCRENYYRHRFEEQSKQRSQDYSGKFFFS